MIQFKPQYNTYTCYKDMDGDLQDAHPSGVLRHATYIMKDPYQQHAISEAKRVASQTPEVWLCCGELALVFYCAICNSRTHVFCFMYCFLFYLSADGSEMVYQRACPLNHI